MDKDDIVYGLLLLLTIAFGDRLRRLTDPSTRQWFATIVGVVVVYFVSGLHILHPILVTLVNGLIICYVNPKHCHIASFAFSFPYLLFFRSTAHFGIPLPPAHTNAVQMMLTLKLVGLAFEVHDTAKLKKAIATVKANTASETSAKEIEDAELSYEFQKVDPTLPAIFHYAFCYIGVLTGPYYKFRTYQDMLGNDKIDKVPCFQIALQRLKYVPVYAVLFLVSGYYFPISYAKTDAFFEETSFWYRLWYMTPVFFTFRMRFYSAFILSEVACIVAGLGAYPAAMEPKPGQGPSKYIRMANEKDSVVKYDFETIHNIDEYGSDFAPTVRGGMKSWNMTVQYWLAVNVHKRLPMRNMRAAITMLTSAFWHGVYSGYYLSMLTVPFILAVEDVVRRKLYELNPSAVKFFSWFMKMQWFGYMGMAFLLLEIQTTLHFWKSVYFVGHIVIVIFCVVLKFVPSPKSKPT